MVGPWAHPEVHTEGGGSSRLPGEGGDTGKGIQRRGIEGIRLVTGPEKVRTLVLEERP